MGFSTHWSNPDPEDAGNQSLKEITKGRINHRIEIYTVGMYLENRLGIHKIPDSTIGWLLLPEQRLLEITSGEVLCDNIGELSRIRQLLKYYPPDVRRFKLLALWEQISQEMAFVGRTGMLGDEIGSRIETIRLMRLIIKIAFVLSHQYVPYQKWFTIMFDKLPIARKLKPILDKLVREENWERREQLLCEAYLVLLEEQNRQKITSPITLAKETFHSRPQTVVVLKELRRVVLKELRKDKSELLKSIHYPLGTVNEFIDATCLLENPTFLSEIINLKNL
ncbi:MAG: DUF4037 domain-containing protein [Candidatus Hodarchaeales archaeon]